MSKSNDELEQMFNELLVDQSDTNGVETKMAPVIVTNNASSHDMRNEATSSSWSARQNLPAKPPSMSVSSMKTLRSAGSSRGHPSSLHSFNRPSQVSGSLGSSTSIFAKILQNYEPEINPASDVEQHKQVENATNGIASQEDSSGAKSTQSSSTPISNQSTESTAEATSTSAIVHYEARVLRVPVSRLGNFVANSISQDACSRFSLRKLHVRKPLVCPTVIDLAVPTKRTKQIVKQFDFASPSQDDRWLMQQKRLKLSS